MTRPTQEQARAAVQFQMDATGWTDRSAVTDQAFLMLAIDGCDKAASRRAVDREFDAMMREASKCAA
jgi:hypothetical protein